MHPIFITGIGTGIGKTLVAAVVTEALGASYWKPVQAGFDDGTDSAWVGERISNPQGRLLPETYKLSLPASPHIAARQEGVVIDLNRIVRQLETIENRPLVIEGAGGLFVPLNDRQFIIDLIQKLDATVLLVSRNYLGSINHSLLTAAACRRQGLRVAGWIFNDQYMRYEQEIVQWSGIPAIASIPFDGDLSSDFVREQAIRIRPALQAALKAQSLNLPYL
ncbi:MAG TPA: dethiobiotin synthase [Puia sp.]|jgi:dethiobiotin synthetase|nr:dethiobiotin synthase [Puia sp.]